MLWGHRLRPSWAIQNVDSTNRLISAVKTAYAEKLPPSKSIPMLFLLERHEDELAQMTTVIREWGPEHIRGLNRFWESYQTHGMGD